MRRERRDAEQGKPAGSDRLLSEAPQMETVVADTQDNQREISFNTHQQIYFCLFFGVNKKNVSFLLQFSFN